MPTREELRQILKKRCKTMADFKALVKPIYPYHQENTSWKTEQEKVDNNIEFILDRSDRDRNINVRLMRRLDLPTTEEELLMSSRRERPRPPQKDHPKNTVLSNVHDVIDILNKHQKTILKWYYDNEFFAGRGYDAEIFAAAPLIGIDPLDMKMHCQDLCSYDLTHESIENDPSDTPGQENKRYYYSLTDVGRQVAAHLRNRQPWRKIVKAPWEWVKASLGTILIYVLCQWAWDAFKPELDKQEPPQQQTTQPVTEQEP